LNGGACAPFRSQAGAVMRVGGFGVRLVERAWSDERAMAMGETNVLRILAEPEAQLALTATSRIFGLAIATVALIVEVALPLMINMAEANPELHKRMAAGGRALPPLPIADYYDVMATNLDVRQSVMDDYKATYGGMLNLVNRAAARRAGVTDGQARDVMAAVLPVLVRKLISPS
jgi:hypothetical protein